MPVNNYSKCFSEISEEISSASAAMLLCLNKRANKLEDRQQDSDVPKE